MKLATLRLVLVPLSIAAGALVLRELLHEVPARAEPGRGAPLVPDAVVTLLARRLPTGATYVVDRDRSLARLTSDADAEWSESFALEGEAAFDERGELAELVLRLTPHAEAPTGAPRPTGELRTTACRPRATPVAALRASAADARFSLAADACEVALDVRWSALPDGSVAAQGETHVPCAGFGLPRGDWTRILRDPPLGTLAFDVVLTKRD
ncbi:MAG: hypothetical protein IT453_06140 [Planctomycetes bacterium]|nr:hypothetical protein [Planctomycetota bacterium]